MEYIEVNIKDSTHTEITIGSHIEIYPNIVAEQYSGVEGVRRYLKKKKQMCELEHFCEYQRNSTLCSYSKECKWQI